jgi:hypothetical protein
MVLLPTFNFNNQRPGVRTMVQLRPSQGMNHPSYCAATHPFAFPRSISEAVNKWTQEREKVERIENVFDMMCLALSGRYKPRQERSSLATSTRVSKGKYFSYFRFSFLISRLLHQERIRTMQQFSRLLLPYLSFVGWDDFRLDQGNLETNICRLRFQCRKELTGRTTKKIMLWNDSFYDDADAG